MLKIFNVTLGMYVLPLQVFQAIFGIGIILVILAIFMKKLEVAAMGLAVIQKTIASITMNETVIMIVTFASWSIILVIILYFVMMYSTRKYV
ncbi:hypothetical protein [Mammaliicoccus sciuri]|nr:hypothetical protein [Mammaliicoccus sciuri]